MSQASRSLVLWAVASLAMVVAILTGLSLSFAGNEYLPANADAFYHARRILDSVMTGEPVIQFDAQIHYPEGSWLTWPWGYDQMLAGITRWFGPFASEAEATRVLMNIPVFAAPLAVALVTVLARQLALPLALAAVFVGGFALVPIVYTAFGVGNLDHHFAELLWTLMTFVTGVWFFRAAAGSRRALVAAVSLGAVLGTAVNIHNGLFILQIPVALALALRWLRGGSLPPLRPMLAFAFSLVAVTLLMCLGSQPWREGFFEFYTLSWFHFYIAACVAVFAVCLAAWPPTRLRIALVAVAALLALVPLAASLDLAGEFVSGDLVSIRDIMEVKNPYLLWQEYGEASSTRFYSWLMWLSLPALLLNAWWCYRWREAELQFLALANVLALLLLQMQYRFGPFGMMSLLLTPVLAVRDLSAWRVAWRPWLTVACWALFAVCFVPTLGNWTRSWNLGGHLAYSSVRSVFPLLQRLCESRRGVVLGDLDTGHWVRYHTSCPVVGNVFLLTPQHTEKARQNARLLALDPQTLVDAHPDVRYVLAHHSVFMQLAAGPGQTESPDLDQLRLRMAPIEKALLGQNERLPPQYRLRWQVKTPAGQVYATLYEIVR